LGRLTTTPLLLNAGFLKKIRDKIENTVQNVIDDTLFNIQAETNAGGRIVSDPAGIDCHNGDGDCIIRNYEQLKFDIEDLIITMEAIADPGYRVESLSGNCLRVSGNKCYMRAGGNTKVKAIFVPMRSTSSEGQVAKSVSFIAMGDFGTGSSGQYKVAQAIESHCQNNACDFVLGMGDNMYNTKVGNPYHKSFETNFEKPYENLDMPFYMVIGNHDAGLLGDGDGGSNKLAESQVEYSYRTDRSSEKWKMPAKYYHFTSDENDINPILDVFALDTSALNGLIDPTPKYEVYSYAYKEGKWLDNAISNSTGEFKVAFGHHPYVSNGKHGNAGMYDQVPYIGPSTLIRKVTGKIFKDWFEEHVCGKVDVYFSGHDHNMQGLPPVANCGKTLFVVSGAGAKANAIYHPSANQVFYQYSNKIGFTYVTIRGNYFTNTVYSVDSESGVLTKEFTGTFKRFMGKKEADVKTFDAAYYLERYPDLRAAFGKNHNAASNHWKRYGLKEGRQSSSEFNVKFYLDSYVYLQNAFGSRNYPAALNHWNQYGKYEGRIPVN